MRAHVLHEVKQPLVLEERPALEAGAGEVVVGIKASALNRRDFWITQGLYPGIKPPVVLGSDAVGVVTSVGEGVEQAWHHREVIIDPGLHWGNNPQAQSNDYVILGVPHDGTFATEIRVSASQLHDRPEHLNWTEAAALPLAGVTAFRALFTQGRLAEGETVLITGAGGGVASFALQFAVAAGADVWVTSSSEDKIQQAVQMGASGGFNYKDDEWTKQMKACTNSPSLIIDSAAGRGYTDLLNLAAPGGRIVNYGATAGPPEKFDLFRVFWKQLRLQGSTMGSPQDFKSMLSFISGKQIKPAIDRIMPFEEANSAIDQMAVSSQFGKIVLAHEAPLT